LLRVHLAIVATQVVVGGAGEADHGLVFT
jgi:hypothetical protein